jgi:hypothetical protein
MKKLLLIAAVSVLGFTANAQTEKGKVVLGGSLFYTSQESNDGYSKSSTLSIIPNAGYFISDNLAIGAGLGYSFVKYNQDLGNNFFSNMREKNVIIKPFARYYKGVNSQFKFFGNLAVPITFGNVKNYQNFGDSYLLKHTTNSWGVMLSPGFSYFPMPKLGIEFSVAGITYNDAKYNNQNSNGQSDTRSKQFRIGADLASPMIGVQFYF